MNKNNLSYEMLNFVRPIYVGEMGKGMPAFLAFLNLGAAMIILNQEMSIRTLGMGLVGVLLAICGVFIISTANGWVQKAIYGCCESVFLLIVAYFAAYIEYKEAGYPLNEYILYTQLMGGGIFIIFILLLGYRLKKPAKGGSEERMNTGIVIGLVIGWGMVIVIVGGLIWLYYTVFKQNINLIESSKMLYVAMCLNALVAYYLLKSICCIRYRVEIEATYRTKAKKKRNR